MIDNLHLLHSLHSVHWVNSPSYLSSILHFLALPNHLPFPLLSTPSLPPNPLLFHPYLTALGLQNLPMLRRRSPLIAPCLQNWHLSLLVHEDHDHDAEGLYIIHASHACQLYATIRYFGQTGGVTQKTTTYKKVGNRHTQQPMRRRPLCKTTNNLGVREKLEDRVRYPVNARHIKHNSSAKTDTLSRSV